MALIESNRMAAWYQHAGPGAAASPRDIAQEAYLHAVEYLKRDLAGNSKLQEVLENNTSIHDIKAMVGDALAKYESISKETKTRTWLRKFSARVMYYGQVLDMLSQHHPEYVALAWGTMKFVLTGILNHEKLVKQLARALSKIGDALYQTKMGAKLYPTEAMKQAISRLYAHMILFLQQAVKWYNMSPAGRVFSSIFKPYELDYKDTVEEIQLSSQVVNDIASAAGRAELRDMHDTIRMQNEKLKERDEKLHGMQMQLSVIQEQIETSTSMVLQVATSHKAISENIHGKILQITPRIWDIQSFHILDILTPKQSPEETLQKALSISKRVYAPRMPSRDTADVIKSLGTWVSKKGSSLFLVRVGPRAEGKAKEFATDVIKLLQKMPFAVIWSLSRINIRDGDSSMTEMIKSLIFQALQRDQTIMRNHPEELNIGDFQGEHTEVEWITLLNRLFSKLSKYFIVIEAEDFFHACRDKPDQISHFLACFQNMVDQAENSGRQIKILVADYDRTVDMHRSKTNTNTRIIATIQRPMPVPPHMRMRFASGKQTFGLCHGLKPKF